MPCVQMTWAIVLERKEISSTEIDLIFESDGLYIKKEFHFWEIKEIIYLINIT